jgi:hypothetical protein
MKSIEIKTGQIRYDQTLKIFYIVLEKLNTFSREGGDYKVMVLADVEESFTAGDLQAWTANMMIRDEVVSEP